MIITQVHLVLGTIKGHSKMCSFVTQHNATDVQLACWLQECLPELLQDNQIFISLSWAASIVLENLAVRPTGLNHRPHVTTPAQDLHTWFLVWDQPPGQLMKLWVCTTEDFLHKWPETVSGKLICMLIVLTSVLTWLQCGVVTDFSGKMPTFDGHWHAGEVCYSWLNPYWADGRQRVWSCLGEGFGDVNVVNRVPHGDGGVML